MPTFPASVAVRWWRTSLQYADWLIPNAVSYFNLKHNGMNSGIIHGPRIGNWWCFIILGSYALGRASSATRRYCSADQWYQFDGISLPPGIYPQEWANLLLWGQLALAAGRQKSQMCLLVLSYWPKVPTSDISLPSLAIPRGDQSRYSEAD